MMEEMEEELLADGEEGTTIQSVPVRFRLSDANIAYRSSEPRILARDDLALAQEVEDAAKGDDSPAAETQPEDAKQTETSAAPKSAEDDQQAKPAEEAESQAEKTEQETAELDQQREAEEVEMQMSSDAKAPTACCTIA